MDDSIDGQVCLVRLVHLQLDNLHLHDKQSVNGLRKITCASIVRFSFETAAYIYV
jgi:hypothetical protein